MDGWLRWNVNIYNSLGDRNTAIVLLVRSVGGQKKDGLKISKYVSEK